ncbi:AMP-binding protein [Kitasatospora sp. NPDC002227]|uniref:AMP-binding protein n=1 Tax=Kitasatospora sp. NPDC002227 TaxID=3154773 RepID=UPI00332ACB67
MLDTQVRSSTLVGAPLPAPAARSLGELLPRAAATGRGIVLIGADGAEERLGYTELYIKALRALGGLRAREVPPGSPVVLQLAEPHELLTAFWACVLGGLLPVPLSAAAPAGELDRVRRALGDPWLLTDRPEEGRWLGPVGELAGPNAEPAPGGWDDPAVLVLTAGSSGAPKAVRLSHGNLITRSQGTALDNGLDGASRTFNWMPLDHVSGLVMFHVRDTLAGCTQIHARKDWVLADPLRWLDVVDRHRVDTTWSVNSSFDLVSDLLEQGARRDWDLSCLRYVMSGGQAVKARTVRRFLAALAPYGLAPGAVRPGWGMSETASGIVDHRADLSRLADTDRYVPVGRPHPGVSVRVVDEAGRVVPEGALGHLQVSGQPVFAGYFGTSPDAETFTPDGWFRTGDLAFVSDGALTVTGSADDSVSLAGAHCHGHEIESAVEELPGALRHCTAAFLADGELVVCYSPAPGADRVALAARITALVRERFGVPVSHVVPVAEDEVPRTGTGKPKRAELRASFRSKSL